jgi:hypothetical protein
VNDYPAMIAPANHVEPVPCRIRAFLAGEKVLDTTQALDVLGIAQLPAVLHSPRGRAG